MYSENRITSTICDMKYIYWYEKNYISNIPFLNIFFINLIDKIYRYFYYRTHLKNTVMAQININVIVDIEKISTVIDTIPGEYITMESDQYDCAYLNHNLSKLVTRVDIGDALVWNIESNDKDVIFAKIVLNDIETTWFVEQNMQILLPSADGKIRGTVSDVKSGDVCSYNIWFGLKDKPILEWSFDPLIEARLH